MPSNGSYGIAVRALYGTTLMISSFVVHLHPLNAPAPLTPPSQHAANWACLYQRTMWRGQPRTSPPWASGSTRSPRCSVCQTTSSSACNTSSPPGETRHTAPAGNCSCWSAFSITCARSFGRAGPLSGGCSTYSNALSRRQPANGTPLGSTAPCVPTSNGGICSWQTGTRCLSSQAPGPSPSRWAQMP